MQIRHFLETDSCTFTYVVWDETTLDAVIIDPVWNFDPVNLRFSEESLDELIALVEAQGLRVHYSLETHIHADHITGADRLRQRLGIPVVAGTGVRAVQQTFAKILGLEGRVPTDGSQFDHLLDHGESIDAGSLHIETIHTPGHTPACVCYRIGDALFTGDTMFMPDFGTGRCDFPNGSPETLYDSIVNRLYVLPEETRVFVGHDYCPGGRDRAYETTIGDCKNRNKQLTAHTSKSEFVEFRTTRDAQLNLPKLLYQSVQINIDAGRLPPADAQGRRLLVTPLQHS